MRVKFWLLAVLAGVLAGCGGGGGGGGGNGLSLGNPAVAVLGLETNQTVTVKLSAGGELVFSGNTTRRFATEVQDGKRYTLTIAGTTGNATCRFSNGQQSISSSDARATIPLACGQVTLPGDGEDDGGDNESQAQLSLALTDALGQPVGSVARPITASRAGRARVTLTNDGAALPNRVINFQTTIGTLRPNTGTALTDAQGVAVITLESNQQGGAGVLTATYQPAGDDVETLVRSVNFQMEASDEGTEEPEVREVLVGRGVGAAFEPGLLSLSDTQLGAGSTLLVTANLVTSDDNQLWSGLASVSFTSGCVVAGTAEIDETVNAINGRAVSTYRPLAGCVTDTIQASAVLNGAARVAVSDQITVEQSPVNSLEFVGAVPPVIGLRGSAQAGAPEVSILTFRVLDSNGDPVPAGVEVAFEVVAGAGGFSISSGLTSSTNSEGQATVTVKSGTVATLGSVRATVLGTNIVGTGSVSVQTGITSQDRFALAAQTLNPRAGDVLGVQVPISIRAADRTGNWVPDGTQVNFTTELGDIEASCETANGGCTVNWTSQGRQTINYDSDRALRNCFAESSLMADRQGVLNTVPCGANDRFGRTTITAWAVGEESFSDPNGNNVYDQGEPWVALPEAFRDDNEEGLYTAQVPYTEFFMDFNEDGSYDPVPSPAYFRGLGCSQVAEAAGHCAQLANVRRSALVVLSTDDFVGYVFTGNADFSNADWQDITGGPPQSWGRTVLGGVVDSSPDYVTENIDGSDQVTGIPENFSGELVVVMADLNGNAPHAESSIVISVPHGSTAGETLCTASGSMIEPMVCRVSIRPPSTPATDPQPVRINFFTDSTVSMSRSRLVEVY